MATNSIIKISHSQLASWSRCRFAWNLSYKQGWKRKEQPKFFQIGNAIHEILAKHYSGTPLDELLVELNRWAVDGVITFETYGIVAPLITKYIRDYAPVADTGWQVIEVEKHFTVPLLTPKGRDFELEGYIDILARKNGKLGIWDHKSFNKMPIKTNEAMMDSQVVTYMAALQKLTEEEIYYLMFNQLNTYSYKDMQNTPLEKLFIREETYRSQKELENFLNNLGAQVDNLIDEQSNIFRNIKRDCANCMFLDPCQLNLKGIPILPILQDSFTKGV